MLGGCGSSNPLPSDAVARVGDTVIPDSAVERSVAMYLATQAVSPRYLDPPRYGPCVAQQGGSNPRAHIRRRLERWCRDELRAQRRLGVHSLIRGEWVSREARRFGLHVSEREVKRALEAQQVEAAASGQRPLALKRYGLTQADVQRRVRATLLEQKLFASIEVPRADAIRFYRHHREQLSRPAADGWEQITSLIGTRRLAIRLREHYGNETQCATEYQVRSVPECSDGSD